MLGVHKSLERQFEGFLLRFSFIYRRSTQPLNNPIHNYL
jgi:hypothetical protein